MPVEEQLVTSHQEAFGDASYTKIGQRLTIADRTVTKLAFLLAKGDATAGTVTFTIRRISPDEIIVSKLWGNAVDLPVDFTWLEVTLDVPTLINEEVRILAESSGFPGTDYAFMRYTRTDEKADEYYSRWLTDTWHNEAAWDMAYKYTYQAVLSVTIQPMTDVRPPTAKAHGTITLGEGPCTQHGHCWSTSPNPTIADDKTELGAGAEGPYESTLTDLLPSTTYYVRAYATDGEGTVYSAEVSFIREGPWLDEAELPFTPTGQIFFSPILGVEVYIIDQGTNFYKYNLATRVFTELTAPNYAATYVQRTLVPDDVVNPTKLYCISDEAVDQYGRRISTYTIVGNSWADSPLCPYFDFRLNNTPSGPFTVGERVLGGTSGATAWFYTQEAGFIGVVPETETEFQVGETVTGQTSGETLVVASIGSQGGRTLKSIVYVDANTIYAWAGRPDGSPEGGCNQGRCIKYDPTADGWEVFSENKIPADILFLAQAAAINSAGTIVYGGITGTVFYKYTIATDDYAEGGTLTAGRLFAFAYGKEKLWYYRVATYQQGYIDINDDSENDDRFPENPDRTATYGLYFGVKAGLRRIIAHARESEDGGTELMSYTPVSVGGFNPALAEVMGV